MKQSILDEEEVKSCFLSGKSVCSGCHFTVKVL